MRAAKSKNFVNGNFAKTTNIKILIFLQETIGSGEGMARGWREDGKKVA